jgi:hypothetical protein
MSVAEPPQRDQRARLDRAVGELQLVASQRIRQLYAARAKSSHADAAPLLGTFERVDQPQPPRSLGLLRRIFWFGRPSASEE